MPRALIAGMINGTDLQTTQFIDDFHDAAMFAFSIGPDNHHIAIHSNDRLKLIQGERARAKINRPLRTNR